jgi:hypothetical protein
MYSLIILAPDNTYYEIETTAADALRMCSEHVFSDLISTGHD